MHHDSPGVEHKLPINAIVGLSRNECAQKHGAGVNWSNSRNVHTPGAALESEIGHSPPLYDASATAMNGVHAIPVRCRSRQHAHCIRQSSSCRAAANLKNIYCSSTDRVHLKMDVQCINVRSITNKALSVSDLVVSQDIDILAVTETWLGSAIDQQVIADLVPKGYTFYSKPRPSGKQGGGVAILFKSALTVTVVPSTETFTHFEHVDYYVTSCGFTFRLCVVYRPPPSARNGFRNSVSFEQWSAYMDMLMLDAHDIIVTGDTNFHLDVFTDADAQRFSDILFEHGMIQLVEDATHKKGHLLDVVIVRDSVPCIIPTLPIVYDHCLCTTNGNLSGDHMAVKFVIDVRKPARLRKKIIFRRWHHICVPDFGEDLHSLSDANTSRSVEQLVLSYNDGLHQLVERHAPLCTLTVSERPDMPWYNDELRCAKSIRRKAEGMEKLWP